jgi:lysophospholipase L1-like esterase
MRLHAMDLRRLAVGAAASFVLALGLAGTREGSAQAAPRPAPQKWVTSWAASAQGPYPMGNPSAQPEQKFAFPDPATGADDQTFRLIVRPDVWGTRARLRFSNFFGTSVLALDNVYVGLQSYAGNIAKGTNHPVTFGGKAQVAVPAGQLLWSDPVALKFPRNATPSSLDGRKLAVSFHVAGASGPMTWHAKALQTSYVTAPMGGVHSRDQSDTAFPYSTASWFFLDVLDMSAPANTAVTVCFGDSITDGTGSTMNGDDRWPDVLAQRLHARNGPRVVVVNEGIGGNRVVGPADYKENPIPGGPGALDRLERDVLSLSGVTTVIWMEGINDYGAATTSVEAVTDGYREGIRRMRAKGIKVLGATLTSGLNSTIKTHGTEEVDAKRKETNEFIRHSGAFDAVVDFDAATIDSTTGELRLQMQPNSTTGGAAGDKLHPNRAGYAAMANSIDLSLLAPRHQAKNRAAAHQR